MVNVTASADVLTAEMVAAAAYAVGADFGVTFSSAGWTSLGAKNMMLQQLDDYCGGRTIVEVFGAQPLKTLAGKLMIAQTCYNAVVSFLNWLTYKFGLDADGEKVGTMLGDEFGANGDGGAEDYLNGWELTNRAGNLNWVRLWQNVDGRTGQVGGDNVKVSLYPNPTGPFYYFVETGIQGRYIYYKENMTTYVVKNDVMPWSRVYPTGSEITPEAVTGQSTGDLASATVLNPGKAWVGDLGADPDTNLADLMQDIFDGAADVNIDVDSSVVDDRVPATPIPTVAPGDIDGYWNREAEQLGGIGNDIGNIADDLDDLRDIEADQTDILEGIEQGIVDQTGALTNSLDQLGESVDDLSQDISNALDVPTAQEIADYKFDLRTLFPFCIPFDIYNILRAFDGMAAAPHVQLPVVIPSINFSYTLDLDFQQFNPVAAVLRQVELLVYALCLAYGTSKVIRW